jgi:hypothetical protein
VNVASGTGLNAALSCEVEKHQNFSFEMAVDCSHGAADFLDEVGLS